VWRAKHGDCATPPLHTSPASLRSSHPNRDSVKLVVSYRKKLRFRDNLGYAITIHLADGMGCRGGPDPGRGSGEGENVLRRGLVKSTAGHQSSWP